MSQPFLSTGRRAAVIAVIVAVELASTGLAIGMAASGMTTVVTVSVDGAAGAWAPALSAPVTTTSTSTAPVTTTSTSIAPVEQVK